MLKKQKKTVTTSCFHLSFSLFVLFCSSSIAGDSIFSLTFEELSNIKLESASKRIEYAEDAAASATVITKNEIQRLGIRSFHELMNFAVGAQVSRTGHTSESYQLKMRADNSGVVLFLLNGIRINQFSVHTNSPHTLNITLEDIDKIEVIRGPSSAQYGRNAVFGLVNIITSKNVSRGTTTFGNDGNIRFTSQHSFKENDFKTDIFLSYNRRDGEDYPATFDFRNGNFEPYSDPFDQFDLSLSVEYKNWSIYSKYLERKTNEFWSLWRLGNDVNKSDGYWLLGSLNHKTDFSHLKFEWRDYSWMYRTQNSEEGAFALVSSPQSNEPLITDFYVNEKESLILYEHKLALGQHEVLLGFEGVYSDVKFFNAKSNFDLISVNQAIYPINYFETDWTTTVFMNPKRENNFSFIFQDLFTWSNRLNITSGLRINRFVDLDETIILPRVGVIFKQNPSNTLKFLYSHAFKTPVWSRRFTTNNVTLLGNPDLRPELFRTAELVHSHNRDWYKLKSSIYNTIVTNPIDIDPASQVISYINEAKRRHHGIELEALFNILKDLNFKFNYAWLNQDENSAHQFSVHSASWYLNYAYSNTQNFNISGYAFSDQDITAPMKQTSLPGYSIWNLKYLRKINENWQVSFSINNMFNKDYMTSSAETAINIPNHRRSFWFSLEYYL